MQRLIAEFRRLFLLPADADADPAALEHQLHAQDAPAATLVDDQGRTRLMVIGFDGVSRGQGSAHCAALLQLGKALMEELGLPEPAFSVNGREGFQLWLPLAEPVPVGEAQAFLALLQQSYFKDLPAVGLHPAEGEQAVGEAPTVALPPGLHRGTGLWAVFIAPGLAPSFTEEAGIDIPPNLDKQAELLARLEPIPLDAFREAAGRLRQRLAPPAEAPTRPAQGMEASQGAAEPTALAPTDTAAPANPVPGPLAGLRQELFHALARPAGAAVVPTPFPGLTALLHGGFRGGRLLALLAPPRGGKTTLAAICLEHAAAQGHPALYVGYDMAREQLVQAALARRLGLDARRIEARSLTAEEAQRVAAALEDYLAREGQCLELWEAGAATTLAEVAAWVRRARAARPGRVPLVVIDPLPLLSTGVAAIDAHPDPARRPLALAAACKDLARGTGAAVLVLRALDHPVPSEAARALSEVRAVVPTADTVLALESEHASDPASQARPLRLRLPGHRVGSAEVTLRHDPACHAMEEMPRPGAVAVEEGAAAALEVFRRHAQAPVPPGAT
ncbi:DnaB-like helicase C-terminal domain-containing protein [Azohydromonas caseinilytica]|uniref:AAA family ATPase n=1 Tax=Azohydromonas caseinilytica TaxID=2728836 RepID=A0A848FG47_9BURK|nr:DnaB-like helicase C-terminal domain-containing protein [Azohydromonas caseinilytica]NML17110.1 AAA family ATPase [Azohydromonas caseinilytica]